MGIRGALVLAIVPAAALLLLAGVARASQAEGLGPAGPAYSLVPSLSGIELPVFRAPATLRAPTGTLAKALEPELIAAVADVETTFKRPFAQQPAVYAYPSRSAFAAGLRVDFGYSAAAAALLASAHGGVFDPDRAVIAIDLSSSTLVSRAALLRHELTHALLRQTAGAAADVPSWLDEGLATLAERRTFTARERAVALSLIRSGRVTLMDLSTTAKWLARDGDLGASTYTIAAIAAQTLVDDLGQNGVIGLLAATAERGSFEAAYEELAGTPLARFVEGFASRVAPAASIAIDTVATGATWSAWSVWGFGAGERVTITIDGLGYHLEYAVTTDALGTYWGTLGGTMPTGDYRLAAVGAADTASAIVRLEPRH